MNVLVIQPGFPAEIPYFVRGFARMGARVLGIGDQPQSQLPDVAKEGLYAYLRIPNLWDLDGVVKALRQWDIPLKLDRVECLWEPGMTLAAQLRREFKLPGMNEATTELFRDKDKMKSALDAAGIRTPRHFRATSNSEILQRVGEIGYPLIIKPIAGAGSADTYRVADKKELLQILPLLDRVAEVCVEEFIEGKEYTFDTICVNGQILYYNMAWYRPNVLKARSIESVSPQTVTLRDVDTPDMKKGAALGRAVLKALGFQTGFSHMEWFLTPKGEAVFGEIGARPPGGRSVELMNYGCDIDVFEGLGEAVVQGKFTQKMIRKYNCAVIFKRAMGQGRIARIEGLNRLQAKYGEHIVCTNLSPIGAPRRNWKQTLVSDGYLIVRHPDLQKTTEMADDIAENLRIFAQS